MKRAIRVHRVDFAAIACWWWSRSRWPSTSSNTSRRSSSVRATTRVRARVGHRGRGCTSGQGQAVTIAGVQVGQVGGVSLQGGRAVVTMNIYKKNAPIYRQRDRAAATPHAAEGHVPGVRSGDQATRAPFPTGASLSIANTKPDIDFVEILSSLDADTRNYLLLLFSGGPRRSTTPARPGPRPAQRRCLTCAARSSALRRSTARPSVRDAAGHPPAEHPPSDPQPAIWSTNSFGSVENQLASLISASNTNFSAIASQDAHQQSRP